MQIDPYLRKELVKEIRYCAGKIVEEEDLQRKTYFYAYAYRAADRIMDFSYDPQIAFTEFVLEISHSTISRRVAQLASQEDTTIPLPEGFFERLAESLNGLATIIEKDEDVYRALEKIVELTYLTSRDGYYQYTKGMMKV